MYCTECGAQIGDTNRFCPKCGAPRAEMPAEVLFARVEALIRRLQAGDQQAFGELFEATKRVVAFHVRNAGVPESRVDDVVQEVYLSAFKGIAGVREPRAGMAWLKRTAYHCAADDLRRHREEVMGLQDAAEAAVAAEEGGSEHAEALLAAPMPLPEDALQAGETARVLRGMVDALPEGQRRVFVAHYLGDVPAVELADELGVSAATVRSRLLRARRQLPGQGAGVCRAHGGGTGAGCFAVCDAEPVRPRHLRSGGGPIPGTGYARCPNGRIWLGVWTGCGQSCHGCQSGSGGKGGRGSLGGQSARGRNLGHRDRRRRHHRGPFAAAECFPCVFLGIGFFFGIRCCIGV